MLRLSDDAICQRLRLFHGRCWRPEPLRTHSGQPLQGAVRVPGDKSMSHRALILGTLARGTTRINGLLEGEDVLATAEAMRQYGATITRLGDGTWTVDGVGVGALLEPDQVIDCGNAGTGVRLIMGMAAAYPFASTFTGDGSLRKRPMNRVLNPLHGNGRQVLARDGGLLPLTIRGNETPLPDHLHRADAIGAGEIGGAAGGAVDRGHDHRHRADPHARSFRTHDQGFWRRSER
jgi:hypothetical protein